MKPPIVVTSQNPLVPVVGLDGVPVPVGTKISDLASLSAHGVCVRLNGQWVLREQWERPLAPNDILEIHELAAGGDEGSNPLQLILTLAAMYFLGPGGLKLVGLELAAVGTLATAIISAAFAPKAAAVNSNSGTSSPTYTTGLGGNQARVDEPVPVVYGRHVFAPPHAMQPYSEYDNTTNDQYYHALLCVGMGYFYFYSLKLDDTPLSHFEDVEYEVLGPGQLPTLVEMTVETSTEVSGQDLTAGRFVGGFAACRPRRRASSIGIDIIFDGGLGDASGGSGEFDDKSVTVRIDVRDIDDFGVVTGAWETVGTETITAATSDPIRRTYTYALGSPGRRVEVRCIRTTQKDDNTFVANDPKWGGLRAYLDETATLASGATHIAIRMRASAQLNQISQNQIYVDVGRGVRTWHPDTGWSGITETRLAAWALADKWTNTEYGDGLPDSRIDLQGLYEMSLVSAARQDRFDFVFDTALDSDTADQLIARSMRCKVFRRNGVRTLWRDGLQTLPVAAYGSRDLEPDTAEIGYALDVDNIPNGLIIEYMDLRTWDWEQIECPAPGYTVTDTADSRYDSSKPMMDNVEFLRLAGIIGATHAEREGLYEAAARYYRRRVASWATELQGLLPAFGQQVVFAPALQGWGQSGDVAFWDETNLVVGLSDIPTWVDVETHYISFIRDDGSLTEAITVTPGVGEHDVVLAETPDFDIIVDDGTRERTRYVFGHTAAHRRVVIITDVSPQALDDEGSMRVSMEGLVEDDRVHAVDNHLLPSPGDDQDPFGGVPADEPGGGHLLVPALNTHAVETGLNDPGWEPASAISLGNDGFLRTHQRNYFGGGGSLAFESTTEFDEEWITTPPMEVSEAALYEARATILYNELLSGFTLGGTFGSWVSLGTTQDWEYRAGVNTSQTLAVRLEIREVSTGIIQASNVIYLTTSIPAGGA